MARTSRRRHTEATFSRGSIRGVEEAVRSLRAQGDQVLLAAKRALKDGVDVIVADAKSRCPVRTGKLRDSIKAISLEDGAAYVLTADAKNAQNIAYGQFVEFDPKIAHPFLYPAAYANINQIRLNIKAAIKESLT